MSSSKVTWPECQRVRAGLGLRVTGTESSKGSAREIATLELVTWITPFPRGARTPVSPLCARDELTHPGPCWPSARRAAAAGVPSPAVSITEDQAPTLTEAQAGRIERHARASPSWGGSWPPGCPISLASRISSDGRRGRLRVLCRGDSAPFFVERGGDPRLSRAVRVPLLRDGRSRFAGFLERHTSERERQ